jgi:hypothetical protein
MVEYLAEVCRMEKFFDGFQVWYVPHLDNCDTDHLAWITSSRAPSPPVKPVEEVNEAINQDLMVIDEPEQSQRTIG